MITADLDVDASRASVIDITDAVSRFCRSAGGDGLLSVFVPHATAGVALMETGSGSEADLVDALEHLLPRHDRYRHAHGSPGHGADHLLPALVSPSGHPGDGRAPAAGDVAERGARRPQPR